MPAIDTSGEAEKGERLGFDRWQHAGQSNLVILAHACGAHDRAECQHAPSIGHAWWLEAIAVRSMLLGGETACSCSCMLMLPLLPH